MMADAIISYPHQIQVASARSTSVAEYVNLGSKELKGARMQSLLYDAKHLQDVNIETAVSV